VDQAQKENDRIAQSNKLVNQLGNYNLDEFQKVKRCSLSHMVLSGVSTASIIVVVAGMVIMPSGQGMQMLTM
jgi:hypothetical protein